MSHATPPTAMSYGGSAMTRSTEALSKCVMPTSALHSFKRARFIAACLCDWTLGSFVLSIEIVHFALGLSSSSPLTATESMAPR